MSANRNLFEEKGEPKRNRAEALLLTSLTNALPLGQTGHKAAAEQRRILHVHCSPAVYDAL